MSTAISLCLKRTDYTANLSNLYYLFNNPSLILLSYCRSFRKDKEEVKIKNLVKESDEEEDDNGDVDNASLEEAHLTPKKRTKTKKRLVFLLIKFALCNFSV